METKISMFVLTFFLMCSLTTFSCKGRLPDDGAPPGIKNLHFLNQHMGQALHKAAVTMNTKKDKYSKLSIDVDESIQHRMHLHSSSKEFDAMELEKMVNYGNTNPEEDRGDLEYIKKRLK